MDEQDLLPDEDLEISRGFWNVHVYPQFGTAATSSKVSFLQLPESALTNAAAQKLAGLSSTHPRTQFIMLALKGKKIGNWSCNKKQHF